MIGYLIMFLGLIAGAVVGVLCEEWGESQPAESLLDSDPGLATRETRANIAADVRRAEEQIRRLSQPQVGRPRRP